MIGQVYFGWDDDPDGAAAALRRAGYHVTQHPFDGYHVTRLHPFEGFPCREVAMLVAIDCDSDATSPAQPTDNDDKVMSAVMREITKIVRPFGDGGPHCQVLDMVAADNVPPDDELFDPPELRTLRQ
jgi:hypothetical protein